MPRIAAMTTLTQEPRFSVDSLRLLTDFQQAFRARVYNLVEDHVRETGRSKITREELEHIIEKALREFSDRVTQQPLFTNG